MAGLTTYHGSGRPTLRGYWLQSPGNRQLTYDDGNNGGVANIMIDSDDHWDLPGRNSPGQAAGVDAHFYASVVYDYYQSVHQRNSFDNGGASMRSIVHAIADNLNDAFWNGQQVVYGDGNGSDIRELSGAVDVVGHEWTHAYIQFTSNLIYQDESGALSESFSDQMGTSIEFYADEALTSNCTQVSGGCADWLVGEDVWMFSNAQPGLRNMADPEEYGSTDPYFPVSFPDHFSEWFPDALDRDNGGVHINSGIANHAYYLLVNGGPNASCASPDNHNSGHCIDSDDTQDNYNSVTAIGLSVTAISLADAEKIFYQAFTALSSGANMCAARDATEAVATSLFSSAAQQVTSTTDAWVAVGLTDLACGLAGGDTTPPETNIAYSPNNPSSSSEATFEFTSSEGAPPSNAAWTWPPSRPAPAPRPIMG